MKFFRYAIMAIAVFILGATLYYLGTNLDAMPPFLSGMLMMFLPIALAVWLIRKFKTRWGIFFIGTGTFVLSQVFHIPFNYYLLNPYMKQLGLKADPGTLSLLGIGALLGLSAGLFEEISRFIALRYWAKDARNWKDGLMFGAGHGGMEAMLVGAGAFYVFLQAAVLRGMDVSLISSSVAEAISLQTFIDAYWSQPGYLYFMGALERISAMAFHVAASVMVLRAITRQRTYWVYLAIGWHTVFNMVAVYGSITSGILWTEAILFGFGLLSVLITYLLREPPPPEIPDDTPLEAIPTDSLRPAPAQELTSEDLEGSRYD